MSVGHHGKHCKTMNKRKNELWVPCLVIVSQFCKVFMENTAKLAGELCRKVTPSKLQGIMVGNGEHLSALHVGEEERSEKRLIL